MQRQGSHEGYDRRCLGLDEAEVKDRLERGERNIVRFKASSPPPLFGARFDNGVLTVFGECVTTRNYYNRVHRVP